jgi:hypothetical protein
MCIWCGYKFSHLLQSSLNTGVMLIFAITNRWVITSLIKTTSITYHMQGDYKVLTRSRFLENLSEGRKTPRHLFHNFLWDHFFFSCEIAALTSLCGRNWLQLNNLKWEHPWSPCIIITWKILVCDTWKILLCDSGIQFYSYKPILY